MVTKHFFTKLFSENQNWTFLLCPKYSMTFHFTENVDKNETFATFLFHLFHLHKNVVFVKYLLRYYDLIVLDEKMRATFFHQKCFIVFHFLKKFYKT